MALTKTQYDSIKRGYEERQTRNMRLLAQRRQQVYAQLPEYRELDTSVGATSVAHARLLLDGDDSSLADLKRELASKAARRRVLLSQAGYPPIIWNLFTTVPIVWTPAISAARNATASVSRKSLCSMSNPASRR